MSNRLNNYWKKNRRWRVSWNIFRLARKSHLQCRGGCLWHGAANWLGTSGFAFMLLFPFVAWGSFPVAFWIPFHLFPTFLCNLAAVTNQMPHFRRWMVNHRLCASVWYCWLGIRITGADSYALCCSAAYYYATSDGQDRRWRMQLT